ncbi:uncharacterized protein RHIMIDRAFT_291478 [Rhizopus microsporus ATCC 52813]|uniref:Uncharacterized protein n=1 Tax=Rhizopus microsporus ATCC 52813 TaxID=1340429 RepID=A0A2G4SVW0_RHIZD|nr:uncharacterized protein RHIMIDRAFT_291478 [Rhizopus microsporus ATCC 52813]PHZ12874.1 hypothetical protein RHIMIDRAFT_291478 [Rhizopus microsporus ATCC 52813]
MKRHSTSSSSERPSKGAKLNGCTVAPTQEANYSSTVNQEGAPSSSSKPGLSKKAQQKIDKQNALLKFKTEQKALKEVKCPSCELTTHARSTSNLCPNKKAKVPVCSPDERVENFVIKTSLPNVCNNQQLVQYIKDLTDYTTKVLFVGSLFANFIFVKLLDDSQTIPIIEQSLFTNIFAVMTENGKRALNYLKEYFTLFCELTTVDRDSLKSINYSSIPSIAGKKTESDLTDFYYHLFNFTKLGFRTRDSLTSGKKFRNVITTDGHSISFLFTRTVKRSLATTKNPSDFIDDIRNGCDIWGVGPGVSTTLTAVDTSGRQRTTSLDEYYHLCGYNNANFIRKKHQEQHTAQFLKISNLSSLKTSNITEFTKACQERLSLYDDITSYYNENAWSSKLKFQCYIRKQKGVHEICKRLMHGSVKYNKKASTRAKTSPAENESKYCPPAPLDHPDKPRKTIIAFSDGMFNNSLRGNRGAPVRL